MLKRRARFPGLVLLLPLLNHHLPPPSKRVEDFSVRPFAPATFGVNGCFLARLRGGLPVRHLHFDLPQHRSNLLRFVLFDGHVPLSSFVRFSLASSDSMMTPVELRSPNPLFFRVAHRNSQEISGLDIVFVLIDGTKTAGQVSYN